MGRNEKNAVEIIMKMKNTAMIIQTNNRARNNL
jgi:hypothetical protein